MHAASQNQTKGSKPSSSERRRGLAKPKALTMASSIQLGEGLKQFQSEPHIWEPKNRRNKAGSQIRTSNTSNIKDNT